MQMNVLLLDDEPIELEQLEYLIHLHFPSWEIEKRSNGSQALSLVESMVKEGKQLQLALVDIRLPGKNGLDIAAKMKELMPIIDIIVISAMQEFEYAKRSIYLKAVDFIVKPVIEGELVKVLKDYSEIHPEYSIGSEVIQKVMTIVKERYSEALKLYDLSQELYINPNYLSRLFSEEVGVPFSEYLLHYRVEMAKVLLHKQKYWSMQRIAEECGFNSQHYFSTTFKRLTNTTPLKYRHLGV
jgi:two-component system response regulator YesN